MTVHVFQQTFCSRVCGRALEASQDCCITWEFRKRERAGAHKKGYLRKLPQEKQFFSTVIWKPWVSWKGKKKELYNVISKLISYRIPKWSVSCIRTILKRYLHKWVTRKSSFRREVTFLKNGDVQPFGKCCMLSSEEKNGASTAKQRW